MLEQKLNSEQKDETHLPSSPNNGNTHVIGSQCQPGIGELWDYFKEFLEQKKTEISEDKDYRKTVEIKWGLTDFKMNDKAVITISWDHLVQTYCSRMGIHGT